MDVFEEIEKISEPPRSFQRGRIIYEIYLNGKVIKGHF